ncbi:MAG: NDP-sugar synthase [Spirochaetota bacterium]|nr:NDP-sugar synthase [Spirochaetota bacterium]
MKGFIFAAGFGVRLRPITENIPKPLIPVLNLPSICYSVFLLKEAGIREIICNLHYKSEGIIHFFEENEFFGMDISFSIEENILGTGGGLKRCEDRIGDSEFIIINSDVITDIDIKSLIQFHTGHLSPATIMLHRNERAGDIGVIGVSGNHVVDFKDYLRTGITSDLVYTGVAVLSPVILKYLRNDFSSIVYTGYIDLIRNHSICYFEHKGIWKDIGGMNSYWESNICLMNDILALGKRMSGVLSPVPEIISPSSRTSDTAVVRDSVIGMNSVIGEGSLIERSVILPNTVVSAHAVISNSIVIDDRIIAQ